jgi:hypothetical protein
MTQHDICAKFWAILGDFGRFWAILGDFGRFWAILGDLFIVDGSQVKTILTR